MTATDCARTVLGLLAHCNHGTNRLRRRVVVGPYAVQEGLVVDRDSVR